MNKSWLSILLLPSLLHAVDPRETVTPGGLGLLIPTVGYLDTGRRLDDKYNKNYTMIASTINTMNSKFDTIATDTGTLFTNLTSTAVQVSNFINTISTSYIQISTDVQSGGVLHLASGTIDKFNSSNSTITNLSSTRVNFTSGTADNFTSDAATFPYVTAVQRLGLGTVQYTPPSVDGSNGEFLQTDGAGALSWGTAPGGVATVRNFDGIVIGTAGAQNVDAVVTSTEQFNLILASFSARGCTSGATVYGNIYARNGLYPPGTTIPYGINLIPVGSSVVFSLGQSQASGNGGVAGNIMTIYGQVGQVGGFPVYMDASGLAFTGKLVSLKTNSRMNLVMIGGKKMANGVTGVSFVDTIVSSNSIGDLWFDEFTTVKGAGAADIAAAQTFFINGSSHCSYNVKTSSYITNTANNTEADFLGFVNNYKCRVIFDVAESNLGFITIQGAASRHNYLGGYVRSSATNTLLSDGLVSIAYAGYGSLLSSDSVHIDINFIVTGGAAGSSMKIVGGPDLVGSVYGLRISGSFTCTTIGNQITAIALASNDYINPIIRAVIQGCNIGFTDGGTVSPQYEIFRDGVRTASW